MPPIFDTAIPDSTANAVAKAMSNMTESFSGLNNTLQGITQGLQNASCSIGELVQSLQGAQLFADDFAGQNNGTKIYTRTIGLDPVGTINSRQNFMQQVESILSDTGEDIGEIPKVVAAEIPVEPSIIANALGSGQSTIDAALGGGTSLGGFGGEQLDKLGITASLGMDLKKLSNDINFQPPAKGGGFSSDTISYNVLSILQLEGNTIEATIETSSSIVSSLFSIQDSSNAGNNGSFAVSSSKKVTAIGKSLTKVRYENSDAVPEPVSQARMVFQGIESIPAFETIRAALEQEGLYGQNVPTTEIDGTIKQKSIPISDLVDILVKHNIIGINSSEKDIDIGIAIERLVRISGANPQKVGGIVLVGRAPNLGSLARKVQSLAHMMEWLKPLAQRLSYTALADTTSSASGVDFDNTSVDLSILQAQANVGKKDASSAAESAKKSGVTDFKLTPLETIKENPPEDEYKAWKAFAPVQLIPGLSTLGKLEDDIESGISSTTSEVVKGTVGSLADIIEQGIVGVQGGLNDLEGKSSAIDGVVNEMNVLNQKMVDSLNWLKTSIGTGPISLDGHLIGANLRLQSNAEYVEAVDNSLSDIQDPNRPTFGPAPSTSVVENQNQLNAALQGISSPTNNTRIWFGVVLVVIGKDRQDLGNQLRTLTNLLSMDDSAIDLPEKKKLTFSGMKI